VAKKLRITFLRAVVNTLATVGNNLRRIGTKTFRYKKLAFVSESAATDILSLCDSKHASSNAKEMHLTFIIVAPPVGGCSSIAWVRV
jgi:hypothetical protein